MRKYSGVEEYGSKESPQCSLKSRIYRQGNMALAWDFHIYSIFVSPDDIPCPFRIIAPHPTCLLFTFKSFIL
jgi:hypothetical protein